MALIKGDKERSLNTLYLVRHGENLANVQRLFSHRLVDHPLNEKGILQAQQTAHYFADRQIDEIYASPLKRARQTAEIIAERLMLPVVVMENFRELNPGSLEAQPPSPENWAFHDDIVRRWLAGEHDACFPDGDDYHRLWGRMRAGIEQVVAGKHGKRIIIVGHAGIFKYTLKSLCPGVDHHQLRHTRTPNASVSEVVMESRDGQLYGHLIRWGYSDHLYGLAAKPARET